MVWVAAVGPCGFVPVAPGTAGSVAGLAIFWALRSAGSLWVEGAALAVICLVGAVVATRTEACYERTDPGVIVIDEVAGVLVTLFALPVGLWGTLLGFLLFRLFDITKPFPVRQAERIPAGWGVMADDIVAGLYAHLALRLVLATGLVS